MTDIKYFCIYEAADNLILGVGTTHVEAVRDAITNGGITIEKIESTWEYYPIQINKVCYERVLKYGGDLSINIHDECVK